MSLVSPLAAFGLRQVLGDGIENVAAAIGQHFRDHAQTLPTALRRAHDRTWQALAVALAGDSLLERIKVFFASGDDKGVREQLASFLRSNAASFAGTPAEARVACLEELRQLRKSGRLSADGLAAAEIGRQAGGLRCYGSGEDLIAAARQAVERVADVLAADCPNLSRLLRTPTPDGPPLLAAAFCYFFRREVESNEQLAHGLTFDGLRRLSAAQARGFDEVGSALALLGERFDSLFEQAGRAERAAGEARDAAVAARDATLDLHAELQRLNGQHLASLEEVRALSVQVQQHLARLGMHAGELRSQHSFSLRSEEERRIVRHLLARFRQLPAEQRQKVPALLNGLGKLQVGAGDFQGARASFAEVASLVAGADARAEACFNTYRTALEEKSWDAALEALVQAASLNPPRFAPFPLHRYEPRRILGAGGFGVALLCRDRNFDEDVVVKVLHEDELERGLDEVFREARVLRRLSHPAIIGIRDCEYANPVARARPYLVLDYFPGQTLEQFVEQNRPLTADELLVVSRLIAQGMQAAHGQGVLHRDLKPANILVRKEGESWELKIIDFGLALAKGAIETSRARAAGEETMLSRSVAGTLSYAPPEQMGKLPGTRPGPYSDVYAFGKTCCYALFRTTEPRSRHLANLPSELRDLLERCIEHDLEHRHRSFEPVLQVLERERRAGDLVTVDVGRGVEMKFAWVPPGTFLMGSPADEPNRLPDETRHYVTLSRGFYLGAYPVTQAQWTAVMGSNPSRFKGDDNCPVETVSWDDCMTFCRRLSDRLGRRFRLPTEAEWEYACRAGTTTAFSFGQTASALDAICDCSSGAGVWGRIDDLVAGWLGQGKKSACPERTTPVGSFPPNPWGLYDMHGNVWEWCADWYGPYPEKDVIDPEGARDGTARVVRGGSWYSYAKNCRSARRESCPPDVSADDGGCRIVLCPD